MERVLLCDHTASHYLTPVLMAYFVSYIQDLIIHHYLQFFLELEPDYMAANLGQVFVFCNMKDHLHQALLEVNFSTTGVVANLEQAVVQPRHLHDMN